MLVALCVFRQVYGLGSRLGASHCLLIILLSELQGAINIYNQTLLPSVKYSTYRLRALYGRILTLTGASG